MSRRRRMPRMPKPRPPPSSTAAPCRSSPPAELRRYSRHLIMPEVGMEGQRAQGIAGADGRHRRPRLAAGALPRRRRRRPLGLVDFDVVDESNLHRQVLYGDADVGRPKLEAAGGAPARASTRTSTSCRTTTRLDSTTPSISSPTTTWWSTAPTTSRPATWSTTPACCRQAERLRLDLPLRGAGVGVLGRRGAVLPLPLPGAAAAGAGAVVRRGRRARRAAGDHRRAPGQRGDQAAPRHRRAADRPPAPLRRPAHALPRAQAAEGPELPGLLGAARPRPS